ncbi:Alcohol acetyltransferase [Collariella sp. IMI 366227]|nr:Alcohol acetyltransferase [Collariella sp. IMI 366227]
MAGPMATRAPTCLACLRRLAQPFASTVNTTPSAVSLVQVRAKSRHLRPKDQGVVVRLLDDIPKFGRKDSIFRTERGRMRNEWFPNKKAEYMTATRFRELGMTREDIGERDATFGAVAAEDDIPESVAPLITVHITTPEKAHTILSTMIPETLTFHRKPIPAPALRRQRTRPAQDPTAPLAIFGSVSAGDVAGHIKMLLMHDSDGSRMVLGPDNIRFLGMAEDSDRIKALGRWEIEISPGGTGLEPVRKVVEILPLVDSSLESEA